jgi:hypothetical protein
MRRIMAGSTFASMIHRRGSRTKPVLPAPRRTTIGVGPSRVNGTAVHGECRSGPVEAGRQSPWKKVSGR